MKVNYKCKGNDTQLQFHCKNKKIDEIWIQIIGDTSWTVIGFNDLQNGISKALKKCKLKDSHDFGGGYIGEALFNLDLI